MDHSELVSPGGFSAIAERMTGEWMDLRVEKDPEQLLDLVKLLSVSICQELIQLFSENLEIGLIGIEFKECGGRHVHCVSQSNDQFE